MLTVDGLRQHIVTSLEDEALQLLLDAAYEAIDEAAGSSGNITELLRSGSGDLLMLSRPAASILSIYEGSTALEIDDWSLSSTGQLLRRLNTGTHPQLRWKLGARIQITYAPRVDEELRDQVAVGLVKLDMNATPGVASQRLGEWAETYGTGDQSYTQARAALLASLSARVFML